MSSPFVNPPRPHRLLFLSQTRLFRLPLEEFPLISHGFERCRVLGRTMRRWKNIERTYKRSFNALERQRLFLRVHLRKLVLPLVMNGVIKDAQLETLLADPGDLLWKETDINNAIKTILSTGCETETHVQYWECCTELVNSLYEISHKLGWNKKEFQAGIREKLIRFYGLIWIAAFLAFFLAI